MPERTIVIPFDKGDIVKWGNNLVGIVDSWELTSDLEDPLCHGYHLGVREGMIPLPFHVLASKLTLVAPSHVLEWRRNFHLKEEVASASGADDLQWVVWESGLYFGSADDGMAYVLVRKVDDPKALAQKIEDDIRDAKRKKK